LVAGRHLLADHEERRPGVIALEHAHERRRVRPRAIVKADRHLPPGGALQVGTRTVALTAGQAVADRRGRAWGRRAARSPAGEGWPSPAWGRRAGSPAWGWPTPT